MPESQVDRQKEDSAYGISDQDAKDYLAKAQKNLQNADEVQALTDKRSNCVLIMA